mmetsp:Transcript_12693/g.36879  ORF Transcript_12693/g.36879 Transcript_12693/m.36879 type:complete len:97 (+) Transcript_12693:29-319(+)
MNALINRQGHDFYDSQMCAHKLRAQALHHAHSYHQTCTHRQTQTPQPHTADRAASARHTPSLTTVSESRAVCSSLGRGQSTSCTAGGRPSWPGGSS